MAPAGMLQLPVNVLIGLLLDNVPAGILALPQRAAAEGMLQLPNARGDAARREETLANEASGDATMGDETCNDVTIGGGAGAGDCGFISALCMTPSPSKWKKHGCTP